MDSADLLKGIYRGLLGREPEPEAEAYLTNQFENGRSYEELLFEIASSSECRARLGNLPGVFVSPGHFYSPVTDPNMLAASFRDPELAPIDTLLPGIRLNADIQLKLWDLWRPMLATLPFPDEPDGAWRYSYQNPAFGAADAAILHCVLRWLRPKRFVEVGSGHSSACALDTISRYLDGQTQPTFIDPHPEALQSLLHPGDDAWITQHATRVQDIDPDLWDTLEANDILFVDSSHVVKTGSDVLAILFDILPRLRSGVVVHFHDIFFPFEYPRHWVLQENRSWNEAYALRAFLTNNGDWEIMFFCDHFRRLAPRLIEDTCPNFAKHGGGSLWLRRI